MHVEPHSLGVPEQLGTAHRRTDLSTPSASPDRAEQADLRPFTTDVVLAAVGEPKCCGAEHIARPRLV